MPGRPSGAAKEEAGKEGEHHRRRQGRERCKSGGQCRHGSVLVLLQHRGCAIQGFYKDAPTWARGQLGQEGNWGKRTIGARGRLATATTGVGIKSRAKSVCTQGPSITTEPPEK